ncbi:MAG: phage terminase large subunit family protein [Pseudaminobacter sp.]
MRNERLAEIRRNAMRALMPPPRLTLSEWIEQEIRLPAEMTALPGSIRLYPFQKGMADAMSDPLIERVTVVKSARIGYTTLLTGLLGSHVVNEPAPVLFVLPTEDDCRTFVVNNVEPTFEASPALAGALAGEGGDGRNTLMARRFPGGSVKFVAAKSPRNLRAHNTRILVVDEADGMEMTREGSPILLAEKRTLQFPDRKIIIGSTPTYAETSHVLHAYEQSDKRIFEVPCPECGAFHEIRWGDIRWPEGEPDKAAWHCPSCGCEVEERHKPAMVAGGKWRATAPHVEDHAGFKINALVSLLANTTWRKLAREFVAAKHDPNLLQTFVNTMLAEGWREGGEEIDDAALAARALPFGLDRLPEDVLAITAGVDVQRKDRLEVTFLGWGRDSPPYALGHVVIWGAPSDDETWRELDEVLKQRWQHPLGGMLGVEAAAIDSGDGETMEAVYRFAFPRFGRKIVAIKGVTGKRPWIEKSRQKVKGGNLFIVGVDGLKSHIAARLGREGSFLFSDTLPAAWFEQLCSERIVVRYSRGQPERRFERIPGRLAEALDCTVYAFAVRQLVNVNWASREEQLRNPAIATVVPARPRTIESDWMRG